jgi:putative ABC transport system permease protein
MSLLAIFAGAAQVLAAVGISGPMSYTVTQRPHEMGIRVALGASRASVLRLVLGQSLSLALVGIALALAGSLITANLISSPLFQVSPRDPFSFALVVLLLAVSALLASYLPARRAIPVDPMIPLRCE